MTGSGGVRTMQQTDPVLLVDVLSRLFQLFVSGERLTRTRPLLHADGCGEEAVDHDVGVAADG